MKSYSNQNKQQSSKSKQSYSYQRLNIDHLLSSSDRSIHKVIRQDKHDLINKNQSVNKHDFVNKYDLLNRNDKLFYHQKDRQNYQQHQHEKSLLIKKNRFLIQLPKIYPIHKKLLNMKIRDIQIMKYNQKRFHLRGFKFNNQIEDQTQDTTTLQTSQQLLHKSRLSINNNHHNSNYYNYNNNNNHKKQISSNHYINNNCSITGGSIFNQLIFRINNIDKIEVIKNIKVRVYVEQGNNSRLVKQLLRKRVQIKLVQNKLQADIVWTRFSDYNMLSKISKYAQKSYISNKNITNNNEQRGQNIQRSRNDQIQCLSRIANDIQVSQKVLNNKDRKSIQIISLFMHNHLNNHEQISDKKNLFKNIINYCKINSINQSTIIPKTFHIDYSQLNSQSQLHNQINQIFINNKFDQHNFWIIKPGQDTNRGQGITVLKGKSNIISAINQLYSKNKTSLLQQYINPLLYRNRKFDIRCYVLVTSTAGKLHAYWYKQGYLRTCVKQFSYDPTNTFGHLTNDAVQKKHKDYGKYQQANKLSFNDLEAILTQTQKTRQDVIKQMKTLAKHSIKSVQDKLRGQKNIFGFEIFGYDFLIDSIGKVWLIEVNTNPCLQFSGSLLSRIIWHMVDNSIKIAIDPFLDPDVKKQYQNYLQYNKYECIL